MWAGHSSITMRPSACGSGKQLSHGAASGIRQWQRECGRTRLQTSCVHNRPFLHKPVGLFKAFWSPTVAYTRFVALPEDAGKLTKSLSRRAALSLLCARAHRRAIGALCGLSVILTFRSCFLVARDGANDA